MSDNNWCGQHTNRFIHITHYTQPHIYIEYQIPPHAHKEADIFKKNGIGKGVERTAS